MNALRIPEISFIYNLIKANRLDESFADELIPEVRDEYLKLLEEVRRELTREE